MTRTDHPLTEARAAELWEVHIPERKTEYLGWQSFPEPSRRCFTTILRAAYDAGREHVSADPHHDPRPWQDCTREDIRKGDLVEMRDGDRLHVGVAHYQDEDGDWRTEDGWLIIWNGRQSLRRIPAPTPPTEVVELPTEFGDVILDVEDNNGLTYDRMVFDGTCYARYDRSRLPEDVWAFTLLDGTRVRRAGNHDDGTPRFVKDDA